ncbi:MAG: ATP-dependent helicase [Prevotellaceae bacterium]|nr:ATP-dependent helicase [Candidatus Faecinaster equi]
MITDGLIDIVERDFLPAGTRFDDERRDFIKKMDSCDLLAVPGSGKTTALQAKLACMIKDGLQGILVLSHTNDAVDEIKKNLTGEYARIFDYPNKVCTVQEFVDKFLALPFYENTYHRSVSAIDSDLYYKVFEQKIEKSYKSTTVGYACHHIKPSEIRLFIKDDGNDKIAIGMNEKNLLIDAPKTWKGKVEEKMQEVKKWLIRRKYEVLDLGVLHYDDCYYLANKYLRLYPNIAKILRGRFRYVFIDETQDLQAHQLSIIDKIFNHDECILQRVGDRNQSIFHQSYVSDSVSLWQPRNEMYLNNSLRLTSSIAQVVNAFTLERGDDGTGNPRFVVNGIRQITQEIPPVLLLYTDATKTKLSERFSELIDEYNLRTMPEADKYGFHIIGWNAISNGGSIEKLRLNDLFPNSEQRRKTSCKNFDTLSEYIQCGRRADTSDECKQSVYRALCKAAMLVGRKDERGRDYNSQTIISMIHDDKRKEFDTIVYLAVKDMTSGYFESAYERIKEYITNVFVEDAPLIALFCEEQFSPIIQERPEDNVADGIPVETVHSAKGRTHCATMYVETSYYQYECKHVEGQKGRPKQVVSPFFQDDYKPNSRNAMTAMKMLYVGMSRPTHLLVYASLASNWSDEALEKMDRLGWRIIRNM